MSDPAAVDGPALDVGKLAAARLWAAARMPYLASAIFACTPRSATGSGTVAVDRAWRLHADPQVVATLEVAELGRLLVHLSGHLVRDHASRAEALLMDDDRRGLWARCVDAEINDDLRADRCVPQVAATVPRDLGLDDGGLAEAYFTRLRGGDLDTSGWDCGSGADAAARPWDGQGDRPMSAQQSELLRLGVANEIKRSDARQPGSVPGGWLRWADSVLPSRTDWRRLLDAEIRRACAAVAGNVDYTYRRMSRRSQGVGAATPRAVLPSLFRPVPNVAVVCDTSGSMGDELLQRALAEIERMLTRAGLRATGVPVLAVDTEVHAMRRVSRVDQVRLAGGGGTDMGAGIDAAARLRPRPDVVVVLTDGMTPWPDDPPRGVRVVVGLLTEHEQWHDDHDLRPPDWARVVVIDEV